MDDADKEDNKRYEKRELRDAKNELGDAKKDLAKMADYEPPMPEVFTQLLRLPVSFTVPSEVRASHTHIIGTTNSGKSTLLAQLIVADCQTDAAVIVISPKGFLIPLISKLKCVDSERLLMILPERESPAINIFQLAKGRMRMLRNQIVDLLVWVFSSLLEAD
ncbi:MAG: hypothetical protein IPI73_30285 [Betaproteobacteria bacterium]|nr:hypothetical protein [Betaproteobacteria bacterium]